QRLLGLGTPVLGVCLGAQLLARASHAAVMPAARPEIGWYPVELTDEAANDPVFSALPGRFHAVQWHFCTYEGPAGACELARSDVCTQAFRLGERAWGIQFHAEVTRPQIAGWVDVDHEELLAPGDALLRETDERMDGWTAIGRNL